MKALTQSIAVICTAAFLSSASVWAAKPVDAGGGGAGGGGGGAGGGDTVTEVQPTCTRIADGDGVNISWPDPDGKGHVYSYDVVLDHVGNSWTYTVTTMGNKALSHWLLEILNDMPPQCEGKISDTDPNANAIGPDGSTGHNGVKWNTTGGTFTIVMDDNYQEGLVDVLAKSATYYGVCQIKGPNCPYDVKGRGDDDDNSYF